MVPSGISGSWGVVVGSVVSLACFFSSSYTCFFGRCEGVVSPAFVCRVTGFVDWGFWYKEFSVGFDWWVVSVPAVFCVEGFGGTWWSYFETAFYLASCYFE